MTRPAATGEAELRAARRDRVFDAMATVGLDVLVLGRRDSVAYATGARSLWTAGSRPFGPACVLVEPRARSICCRAGTRACRPRSPSNTSTG